LTTYYLDSSVALRVLLGHSTSAAEWLELVTGSPSSVFVSSRILNTELMRTLRREGQPLSLRYRVLEPLQTIPLTEGILAEAEAIVPHVKTLDAIHLASALACGLDPIIVTHDAGMKATAEMMGLRTHDPVEE